MPPYKDPRVGRKLQELIEELVQETLLEIRLQTIMSAHEYGYVDIDPELDARLVKSIVRLHELKLDLNNATYN